MHLTSTIATGAALVAGALADKTNYLGFNSGSTLPDRSAKFQADFEAEFKTAQGLVNAPGTFNAVRLYTNIQAYSTDDPIEAFQAAIDTKTFLLLGMWASGTDNIDKELSALNKAIKKFGKSFTDLVIGVSVGSEDLYRDSATGQKNKGGVGADANTVIKFIGDYKKAVANTPLSSVPIGHVDTWDAWTNSSNKAVIDAVDWLGVDEYPFYESGKGNTIDNAGTLFDKAYNAAVAAAGGKPVWVTETGWPTTGPNWDQAVPSVANAKTYWDEVGCRKLFNKTPTFWYNLRDSNPDNQVKFAISKDLSTKPQFDLTCPKTFKTPDTTDSASQSGTGTASPGASSTSGSSSGSKTSGSASASGSSKPANGATSQVVSGAAVAGIALFAGAWALL